jgi:hypothetical protein
MSCEFSPEPDEPVELEELARLVTDMRAAQKRYFKDRSQSALLESKQLERKVDRWLEDWTAFGSNSA